MDIFGSYDAGFEALRILIKNQTRPTLIAIAGASCSGKSYLAESLSHLGVSMVVPLDNYFRDRDDPDLPRDESGRMIFDLPDSYLVQQFIRDVYLLLHGQPVMLPQYDKKTNRQLPPGVLIGGNFKIIIAEGLFAISLLGGLKHRMIKVYLDVDQQICLDRRIKRDTVAFGVAPARVEEIYQQKVLPYLRQYVFCQQQQADIIIRG